MEIITEVERRRRRSSAEKLLIVAETEQPGVGIADIARRYEISRGLLWNWRSQVRRGVLRPEPPSVFVPVQVISELAGTERTTRVEPPATAGSYPIVTDGKIAARTARSNLTVILARNFCPSAGRSRRR
jgi:transposase